VLYNCRSVCSPKFLEQAPLLNSRQGVHKERGAVDNFFLSRLGCLVERRELPHSTPSGVWGGAPVKNEFGAYILSVTERFCLEDIINISEMQNYNIQLLLPYFAKKTFSSYFLSICCKVYMSLMPVHKCVSIWQDACKWYMMMRITA